MNNLKANAQRLRGVFNDVTSGTAALQAGSTADPAMIQVSWSRLAVQTQGIAFDAGRLSNLIRAESDGLRQTRNTLVIALLGTFSLFILTSYLILYRRTVSSIGDLTAGARIIGSGNLEYALPEKGDDEISGLAASFNRMTRDLRAVTASKAELEREIDRRKAAEDALPEKADLGPPRTFPVDEFVIVQGVADIAVLLPEEMRLYMVWRGLFPLAELAPREVATVGVWTDKAPAEGQGHGPHGPVDEISGRTGAGRRSVPDQPGGADGRQGPGARRGQDVGLEPPAHEGVLDLHGQDRVRGMRAADRGRPYLREPDVAHVPRPHALGDGADGLFDGYGGIEARRLIEIDIIGPEPLERVREGGLHRGRSRVKPHEDARRIALGARTCTSSPLTARDPWNDSPRKIRRSGPRRLRQTAGSLGPSSDR